MEKCYCFYLFCCVKNNFSSIRPIFSQISIFQIKLYHANVNDKLSYTTNLRLNGTRPRLVIEGKPAKRVSYLLRFRNFAVLKFGHTQAPLNKDVTSTLGVSRQCHLITSRDDFEIKFIFLITCCHIFLINY